jgi:carboxyl-terminal processing protease
MKLLILGVGALTISLAAFGIGASYGSGLTDAQALAGQLIVEVTATPGEPQAAGAAPQPSPSPSKPLQPGSSTPTAGSPLDSNLFGEAWGLLQDQFYGDLPQDEDVTYNAIRGVVERLGDQHTSFVDPEQAELFNSDMEGAFEGIGARVDTAEQGGVEIRYLFEGQPAAQAGVRVGDIITKVDGQDVTKMDLTEAIGLIRGPRNSRVVLTILREDQDAPLEISVTRARIEIPVVETKTLSDGQIEYISLSEFSSVAPQRLSEALKKALDRKPKGLVLDLRGNPGGLLDASVRIGSYFVPQGNILIERFKDGKEREYKREGRYLLGDTPLVVLVDAGSASASEIVAGAIQDAGTGVLMGEKTFGKGSVQLPNTLSDGSQLRVTIARWFTPKDRAIHEVGLSPDIEVVRTDDDRQAERDPQLDRAVEYLLTVK